MAAAPILVVEDEVLIRMPIAQHLRIKSLKLQTPMKQRRFYCIKRWAVVFSDIDMPGAVDVELAKWIREHRPGLDVLLAGTVPRAIESAENLCERGPVPKPYEAQVVHNHIRRLLAARNVTKKP